MLGATKWGRKGRTGKEIRRLIVSAGSKNAGGVPASSSVFSQESRATISSPPSSRASTPRSDRGRPPSYARAHSPAPLVLSPGIYNTLCFPSAICLGFSTPSLTLLSRVLFLFNSVVSSSAFPPWHPRYLSVEGFNEWTPRRVWGVLYIWIFQHSNRLMQFFISQSFVDSWYSLYYAIVYWKVLILQIITRWIFFFLFFLYEEFYSHIVHIVHDSSSDA